MCWEPPSGWQDGWSIFTQTKCCGACGSLGRQVGRLVPNSLQTERQAVSDVNVNMPLAWCVDHRLCAWQVTESQGAGLLSMCPGQTTLARLWSGSGLLSQHGRCQQLHLRSSPSATLAPGPGTITCGTKGAFRATLHIGEQSYPSSGEASHYDKVSVDMERSYGTF